MISLSLAGRKESLLVHPFSAGELESREDGEDFVSWVLEGCQGNFDARCSLPEVVVRGGFPEASLRPTRRAQRWFSDYVASLAQHDAAEISDGPFAGYVTSLLRYLAANGQAELVKAKLAQHLGVSQTTADSCLWLRYGGIRFFKFSGTDCLPTTVCNRSR